MIEVYRDGAWVNEPPIDGERFRQVEDGKPVRISFWREMTQDRTEKDWRDTQLAKTDLMLQVDRTNPTYQEILDYRQALKDYPQQPDFPDGIRPEL